MERESLKATRNQKVFVTLQSYNELIAEYNRVVNAVNEAKKDDNKANLTYMQIRLNAITWVLDTLGLPY